MHIQCVIYASFLLLTPVLAVEEAEDVQELQKEEREYQDYVQGKDPDQIKQEEEKQREPDFKHEDAYIDLQDALRSKAFLHRAILSTAIEDNARLRLRLGRPYINHLMGFNAILQGGFGTANNETIPFTKYVSGVQGLSGGYVSEWGHGFEAGIELSSVSSIFGGYRYFFRPEKFTLWPFFGLGAGYEVKVLSISDGPLEAQLYSGTKQQFFGVFGVLIPLVDVALKVEFRTAFYGKQRVVFTSGIGAIVFL